MAIPPCDPTSRPAAGAQPGTDTLEAYLRHRVVDCLSGHPGVQRIAALVDGVWLVVLAGGQTLIAKHQDYGVSAQGSPWDPLRVEQRVLELLHRQDCPVPQLLGVDRQGRFIFMDYAGPLTLDDLAQRGGLLACKPYIRQTIQGVGAIEQVCRQHQETLQAHVLPETGIAALHQAWTRATAQAHQGLDQLPRVFGHPPIRMAALHRWLDEMGTWLASRPPSLGSVDYHARNLVLDPQTGRLYFIDWAHLGWDWTERRLVQYTTSIGAGLAHGNFLGLLDPAAGQEYAWLAGQTGARALDFHHLFFYLNAAARLCTALEAPEERPHAWLLQRWQQPHQRLERLAAHLAAPLSSEPLALEFRREFRQLLTPFRAEDEVWTRITFSTSNPGPAA